MGFHVCTYCEEEKVAPATSSGDVTLTFANGHSYQVPDMLLHYCLEHCYLAPAAFVADVMEQPLLAGKREQTKGVGDTPPVPVGYLQGTFPRGPQVHGAFCAALARVLRQAASQGARVQTRGGL
jgi:hypothetical protein